MLTVNGVFFSIGGNSLTDPDVPVREGPPMPGEIPTSDVPFEKTWSFYQGEKEACGVCESCVLRLKGFAEAGIRDPVPYRNAVKA